MAGKRGPSLSPEERDQIRAEAMVLPTSRVAAAHDLDPDHVSVIVARGPALLIDVSYVSARKQRAALLALNTLEDMLGALSAISSQIQNREWLMQRDAAELGDLAKTVGGYAIQLYSALDGPRAPVVELEDGAS
jgi:hypothetical protein